MFAIIVSEDTVETLIESGIFSDREQDWIRHFAESAAVDKWVVIRGFVTDRGKLVPWTLYPSWRLRKNFDHDWEKMHAAWDIVVRRD